MGICCLCGGKIGFGGKWAKIKDIADGNRNGEGFPLESLVEGRVPDEEICYICGALIIDKSKSVEERQKDLEERTSAIEKTEESSSEQKKRLTELQKRSPQYKVEWDKNGIIQFKNERIAILQRMWGAQVEFIVAFDDLTNEGYRLMAIDEGKTANGGAGFSGGANAYFYFQKMEYVK
tara:strand:+ start:121 stop:654 length:534 start_codon:yes stop_codon:yes gene_type:complete